MASFYVLYSGTADQYYIGSTKDFVNRFEYHKSKIFPGSFTSKYPDWELFYISPDLPISTARKIEMHIKRMKSRQYIINLNRYPEIVKKLILQYQ